MQTTKIGEELIEKLKRKPFAPFTIRFTNGDQHLIGRPFQAASNGFIVVVAPLEGDGTRTYKIDDIVSIVDVH